MTLNQRIGRALARAFGYHYEASRITREHRHPIGATAQDSKLDASDADRTMLLKLSRYLCSNVGLVRGAIADLASKGVEFRVCNNTLVSRKIDASKVAMEAKVVPSGVAEVAKLQAREGFVYLRP